MAFLELDTIKKKLEIFETEERESYNILETKELVYLQIFLKYRK